VNPQSAVIFSFGSGTVYALRLPPDAHTKARELGLSTTHRFSDGIVLDLAELGEWWIFGRGMSEENAWCLEAFEFSGK
jgi:hypothetical protein